MFDNRSSRIVEVAALALLIGVSIGSDAKAAESDFPPFGWSWAPPPRPEPVSQPTHAPNSRVGPVDATRRPTEKVACASLACPGFVLLGVGF